MLQGHVWGHPWSWEFSPTRCLLFAYAVPTRGSSFIFEFWPCKLRGLRLCRKGNGIVPLAFVSQQNSCYLHLSSNYLCFLDSGNFTCRIELHSSFNLDPQAAKFVESAVAYAASAAKWSNICLCQPTHPRKLPTSNHVQVNSHINLYL